MIREKFSFSACPKGSNYNVHFRLCFLLYKSVFQTVLVNKSLKTHFLLSIHRYKAITFRKRCNYCSNECLSLQAFFNKIGYWGYTTNFLRSAGHISDNPLPLACSLCSLRQARLCFASRLFFCSNLPRTFSPQHEKFLCNNIIMKQCFFSFISKQRQNEPSTSTQDWITTKSTYLCFIDILVFLFLF